MPPPHPHPTYPAYKPYPYNILGVCFSSSLIMGFSRPGAISYTWPGM